MRRLVKMYNELEENFPTMRPEGANASKKEESAMEGTCPNCGYKNEAIDFSKVEIEPLFADFVHFETFSKSDF